jgi:hypothetical protein
VVFAHADVVTGMEGGTTLAHDDAASRDALSTKALDT